MSEPAKEKPAIEKKPNSFYYNQDGSFNEANAKTAFTELFEYHKYSLAGPVLNAAENISLCGDNLWILDFKLADFANVGMGGIFFLNDKQYGYFAHEIYLLPFQMIPQHTHIDAEGIHAKHEAWHVRHGDVWTFSLGGSEADMFKYPPDISEAMQSQINAKAIQCFQGKHLKLGEMNALANLTEPHFMIAGPEGAIVSEYATYHSFEGLVFTNSGAGTANTAAR